MDNKGQAEAAGTFDRRKVSLDGSCRQFKSLMPLPWISPVEGEPL